MTNYTVREVGTIEVCRLIERIMEIEIESFSVPWRREDFIFPVPGTVFAGAFGEDGRLFGYGCITRIGDEADLLNLAVAPDSRRIGAGRAILDFLLSAAEDGGARRCFLEVRSSNIAASSLYASRGFYPVAVRRNYYREPREDAVVMAIGLLQ